MQTWKLIPVLGLVVAPILGAANDCGGSGGKATKASYAGDGVTMFVGLGNRACAGQTSFCEQKGNGKLKFNQGYKAHYVDTTDRTNCKWKLYTINTAGEKKLIKSGGYLSANIKVEQVTRVHVWLKSQDCGDWKPTS